MRSQRLAGLLPLWRATSWEFRCGGGWRALPSRRRAPLAGVSAMNPGAHQLSITANRARDAALRRWLVANRLPLRRCRGRLGLFREDGWLVSPVVAPRLLAAWGQLAGVQWDAGGSWLLWCRGGRTRL